MNQQQKFCGISERLLELARARRAQWVNKRRLKWFIGDRLPGLSLEVLTACYAQAFSNWQKVCGLAFCQTLNQAEADFLILTRRIDGPSGVLAEHELPPGNDSPLHGWFDVGERWTDDSTPDRLSIYLVAVATHEFGHGIGLSHTNVPGSLMNQSYDPRISTPQQWDIAEAVARYGPPVEEPAPAPTPTPAPSPAVPDRFTGSAAILGHSYKVEFSLL